MSRPRPAWTAHRGLAKAQSTVARLQRAIDTMLSDTLLFERRGFAEFHRLANDSLAAKQLLNAAPALPPLARARLLVWLDALLAELRADTDAASARFRKL